MSGKHTVGIVLTCFGLALSGCGFSDPEFKPRDDVAELIPPAQEYMDSLMDAYFGAPVAPVAWEKLPVRYHAATASVGGADAEGRLILDDPSAVLSIQ